MKKKMLSILLASAMSVTLLAGCGGGDTSSDGGSGDAEKTEEGSSDSLIYWSMWSDGEPQAQVIAQAAKDFTEETGIEVDVQFKGRNGIREGLQPALEAGQQIDIFDESLDRITMDWGKYTYNLEELAADYETNHGNEALFSLARGMHESGELYAIPYQATTFGWFYNKTLFEKAGITEEPKTWEEFDAVCAKLKEAGIVPITMDDAYATANIGLHLARYIGSEDVIKLVNNEGITWDDPRVVAAINDYADFQEKGYFSESIATNAFPAGQNQEFAPGLAAMNFNGVWLPNETKNFLAEDFEWGFFNYPGVPDGADPITTNYLASQAFGVNKDCAMPEEAFQFVEYITTGDADKAMVEQALVIPTDKTNEEWPVELESVKDDFSATTDVYPWAGGAEMNVDVTPILKDNTIKLMSGTMTADEFITAMSETQK